MNRLPGFSGLSGSSLKLLAILLMLLDHIGAAVLGRGYFSQVDAQGTALTVYWTLRWMGRLAFPIFCFLLAEGMAHSRDRGRYILRLFAFALLSELPFDLCFYGELIDWSHQNVFWTLGLGALAICCVDGIRRGRRLWNYNLLLLCCLAGFVLQTDYGAFGVAYCVLLYCLRDKRPLLRNLLGGAAVLWELTAPLAFLPIQLYNGKRGLPLKYVFYLFYPAHLFLLGLLTYGLFGV